MNTSLTTKKASLLRKAVYAATAFGTVATATAVPAMALSIATAKPKGSSIDLDTMMGKVIGMVLLISRYVGIALVIYGVYEIVMSFLQNQPEAKTKGIIMAIAGAIMIALKSILSAMQIVS